MDIPAHLPHRDPLLLVDRVLEREPGVRVVAEKLVTNGETYLPVRPSDRTPVPGPFLLEMLAQAGGFLEAETLHGASIFLAGVRDVRFGAPAFPGDQLRLEVAADGAFAGLMRLQGTATREGRELCTATLLVKRL